MKRYRLGFIGLTNPIKNGQNESHWKNDNKFLVDTFEEIEEIVRNLYLISRPEEFERCIKSGIELLDNPKWKEGYNVRSYDYKLVNNSGNPTLYLQLLSETK